MIVLGINGIDDLFHDASASIIRDGRIVASVEEERFNRKKHSNGVPFLAIEFCLKKAGCTLADVDAIGYYLDPQVLRKTFYDDMIANFGVPPKRIDYYARAADRIASVRQTIEARLGPLAPKTKFHFLNHHLCHATSAYYISGSDDAAVLTIDGSGDRETSTLYHGRGSALNKVHDFLVYPQSLGFIYTVMSHHIGFDWIAGPGKLMGLAGFGKADPSLFADVIRLNSDHRQPVTIDLSFFDYHLGGTGFTPKGAERFGPRHDPSQPLGQRQMDLAASVQARLEQAILHIVAMIPRHLPKVKNLCFAGGVALNVCTNRRIMDTGLFDHLFVPPAAADSGTSLGAALYLDAQTAQRCKYPFDVYSGPDINDYDIAGSLGSYGERIKFKKLAEDDLCAAVAQLIAENKIVAWVQGRMECGPRALGNRSILTNAANPRAKDELNTRVKKREHFRPYAPSVLAEHCGEWFDIDHSPHMLLEASVRPDKRARVPGIVHIDGTSRPQTVTPKSNPRYYRLLQHVYRTVGVPMVLNTSFNLHGEPIVNTPQEAINDLLETDLDALAIGDYLVTKTTTSVTNTPLAATPKACASPRKTKTAISQ